MNNSAENVAAVLYFKNITRCEFLGFALLHALLSKILQHDGDSKDETRGCLFILYIFVP